MVRNNSSTKRMMMNCNQDVDGRILTAAEERLLSSACDYDRESGEVIRKYKWCGNLALDRESGEIVNRAIVVLRRTANLENDKAFDKNSFPHTGRGHQREVSSYEGTGRCVGQKHRLCTREFLKPQKEGQHGSPHLCQRNESAHSQRLSSSHTILRIPIWKEFFLGANVFSEEKTTLTLEQMIQTYIPFWAACVIPMLSIFLFLLFHLLAGLKIHLFYFHRLNIHLGIHKAGDKKGVTPNFTGNVFEGPIIYSLREFSCPLCRYKRESIKFFKIMRKLQQEVRQCPVRIQCLDLCLGQSIPNFQGEGM